MWSISDRGETRILPASDLTVASGGRPALFKICGSFESPSDEPDGMVITEEDHWQMVAHALPTELRFRLGREGAIAGLPDHRLARASAYEPAVSSRHSAAAEKLRGGGARQQLGSAVLGPVLC